VIVKKKDSVDLLLAENQVARITIENQNEDGHHNVTFPEDGSFSDSLLLRATQQVEEDSDNSNESMNDNVENMNIDSRTKRDINGNNRKESWSNEVQAPLTSTPITGLAVQRVQQNNETPKCRVLGLSRTRNRSNGKTSSIFESSSDNLGMLTSDDVEETPRRKLLKFDGSPIKVGDFDDDEDDSIFSQMVLPVDTVPQSSDSRVNGSKCRYSFI